MNNCSFVDLFSIFEEKWLWTAKYSVSFLNNLLPGVVADVRATLSMPSADLNEGKRKLFNVLCQDNVSGKKLLAGVVSVMA